MITRRLCSASHAMPTVKGIVYTVRSSLYVALTNHSNTLTLLDSRGSGFKMNSSFEPLPAGFEPTASQVCNHFGSHGMGC